MKKILCLIFALITMILNGCGKTETPDAGKVTTTTTSTTAIATTTTTGDAETTYITVTGEDGAAVTDADGAAVTSAIVIDPTTTATDAATTAADTTTTTTTTATPVVATTQAPVAQPTTTSTTAAPTTTTVADTRPTVMWEAMNMPIYCNYDDPWKYPYDVEACLADCKAYIESKGLTWDESLTLDNSTWAGNTSTVSYSAWPDKFYLKGTGNDDGIFGAIDFEIFSWKTDTRYKVIWMPHSNPPFEGCYEIYVVHR